jgi:hypothetical protein
MPERHFVRGPPIQEDGYEGSVAELNGTISCSCNHGDCGTETVHELAPFRTEPPIVLAFDNLVVL